MKSWKFHNNARIEFYYSVGPVIRKQDFQIARRFLKIDAFPGGGQALPQTPSQERCAPRRV